MNKKIFTVAFSALMYAALANLKASNILDWRDRPEELRREIDRSFNNLATESGSNWSRNGSDFYTLLGVAEEKLARNIITHSEQKEFFFLDIGAGNFQWGDHLASFLNQCPDIANDVKIHLIGVRGERSLANEMTLEGKCHIYKFGAFKIEDLEQAFSSKGIDLCGKLDLIVTSWCFRHLADPLGTMVQAYNLLRPQTGLFFGDGFFYKLAGQSMDELDMFKCEANMINLLLNMKVPFLIHPDSSMRRLNAFVFKKDNSAPLQLPLQYDGTESATSGSQVYSGIITNFQVQEDPSPWEKDSQIEDNPHFLYGEKELFNYLSDNNLFYKAKEFQDIS
jgi:hypothetical protein